MQAIEDQLIVEEPLSIRLDGALVGTTMRTPGHDFELAVGFCFTEGFLDEASVSGVRFCGDDVGVANRFNAITVETDGRAPSPAPRLGLVSSSCGWCGSEMIEAMCARLEPLVRRPPIDAEVLASVPGAVAHEQAVFAATGAAHGAAVFDRRGAVRLVREDVGRHNAVDKVVGAMLLDRCLPANDLGLFVSGRASVEMVQKAWAAGFSTLLAVSAPTSLAVTSARRANLNLTGFVRNENFNVYA